LLRLKVIFNRIAITARPTRKDFNERVCYFELIFVQRRWPFTASTDNLSVVDEEIPFTRRTSEVLAHDQHLALLGTTRAWHFLRQLTGCVVPRYALKWLRTAATCVKEMFQKNLTEHNNSRRSMPEQVSSGAFVHSVGASDAPSAAG
jgi:hypothetical protein